MFVLRLLLGALAAALVAMTVLPFWRTSEWWVRMFDFPRRQIAVVCVGVLGAGAAAAWTAGGPSVLEGLVYGALAVSLAYQAAKMWPYTRLHPVETVLTDGREGAQDRRLRLMVSNVLMENRDGARWLAVVRDADPDVFVAVETDGWWAETAAALAETHPHVVDLPQDDTYGMVVRSRLPLVAVEVRHLVEPEVPSLFLRAALPSGDEVTLVFLHPRPPRPDIAQDSDFRDAELVLAGRAVAEIDGPVVVAGDLNDVAWSHTTTLFQRLSGLLDPRIGRGTFSTFHADHWWLRYPLDHVFHSTHFALVALRRLPNVGSDHFPILIELELSPDLAPLQHAPDADADTRDEAAEVVEDTREVKAEESKAEHQERVEEDQ